MSTKSRKCIQHILSTFFLVMLHTLQVNGVAVMSVDLGAEWMKVAIVSPGVPMEIALNKESKRKTPVAIAFRDGERTFGEDALTVGVRFPAQCYVYFLDLLGKDINNPKVKLFQQRFPYYNIIPDPVRNTVIFKHDNNTTFSPEELVAMMLTKAREFAVDSARQPINDLVLIVPGFFNQAERKSIMIAAEMAGLKVLQLLNDYTAAALNYGIFRRKDFNETAQYVMLYDMGAHSTSAVIISYQTVKSKERGYVETNPQLAIIGVGYDRTLGGLEMQLRLRDYLAKKFNEMKKTKKNVFENPRAMAKLFKEAARLKLILSANQEYYAQIEGLIDEIDFKVLVTRDEFEKLCIDLFERVKNPVERALKNSQLSMDMINQVILVGAGTRVPAVQEKLASTVKIELSKNLNTDEAAVMGAAYKAADLSTGFKVKKFITKDAVLFPIQVTFERGDGDKDAKHVTRTLFSHMNPFPQKKILTFNKHQNDFEFHVVYGDLENVFPEHEIAIIGSKVLQKVKLLGVSEAINKHQGENVEPKGIKVHFNLDESGILTMTVIEYHVEKILTPEEVAAQEYDGQSTFSKLSSTISKLFQAAEDELKDKKEDIKEGDKEQKEGEQSGDSSKPVHEKSESAPKLNGTEKADNKTEVPSKSVNGTAKEAVEKKPKIVLIKEPINSEVNLLTVPHLSGEQLSSAIAKIDALNQHDAKKSRREGALNALESAVIETRSKMDDADFSEFAKAEEAKNIVTKSQEISDWLEDEGYTAEAEVLESKLDELTKMMKPVQHRYKEYNERPDAMKALDQTLNSTSFFLSSMKNFTEQLNVSTGDDPKYTLYTTVEITTLEKLVNDTLAWKEVTVKQQEGLTKSDDPVLNLRSISEKVVLLDREIQYLANKSKSWRGPPPKDKSKDKKSKKGKKPDGDDKDSTSQEEKPTTDETAETVKETESEGTAESKGEEVKEERKHTEL